MCEGGEKEGMSHNLQASNILKGGHEKGGSMDSSIFMETVLL